MEVVIKDEEDFTSELGQKLGVKRIVAKARLANDVAPVMTAGEIDERDGSSEIRGWLTQLAQMLEFAI